MSEKINCYSCNKNKHKLYVRKSAVLSINLMLCESCISSKYEPRWAIVLAGRSNGSDHVREFIIKKRYIGEDIAASELLF